MNRTHCVLHYLSSELLLKPDTWEVNAVLSMVLGAGAVAVNGSDDDIFLPLGLIWCILVPCHRAGVICHPSDGEQATLYLRVLLNIHRKWN